MSMVYRLELTEREKETVMMVARYWHDLFTAEYGGDVSVASSVIEKLRALEPVGTEGGS